MQESRVYISLEFTPNPNTLKYSVNRTLIEKGAVSFSNSEEAKDHSPLASRLLAISGVANVMIGRGFITITKTEDGDWDQVHENSSKTIENHLNDNLPAVVGSLELDRQKPAETDIEKKICAILDEHIRPAVAMDGGDITFERFENGIVYLFLQGSCSGCPSSTMTLKVGIEERLKKEIPEVKEVVSV